MAKSPQQRLRRILKGVEHRSEQTMEQRNEIQTVFRFAKLFSSCDAAELYIDCARKLQILNDDQQLSDLYRFANGEARLISTRRKRHLTKRGETVWWSTLFDQWLWSDIPF